jgi:hypothetical protein
MEFWKEVRRRVLTKEISKRAACETYGLGWHTLNKILAHDEPPGYRQSQPREKRKLAPFLPIIQQILEDDRQAPKKQRHTAKRIFQRLLLRAFENGGAGQSRGRLNVAARMRATSVKRKMRASALILPSFAGRPRSANRHGVVDRGSSASADERIEPASRL